MSDLPADPDFDLDAYLERIQYAGDLAPTVETLAALHQAHEAHIPFENLDVILGVPIRLDPASLQAKLVAARRGGYCFEHNLLFAAVLERLGFAVQKLAARVRYGARRVAPRTHMLLLVTAGSATSLADVGFGGDGPALPVPWSPVPPAGIEESRQGAWTFRVVPESPATWVLQSRRDQGFEDLYAFTLEPQERVDYELANYFTSTHPESWFRRAITVQRATVEERRILRGRDLAIDNGSAVERRAIADDEELLAILAETFGLRFPPGTRFPSPPPAAAA
jgi:N-hydroxyarylamine O-acetyltransferase